MIIGQIKDGIVLDHITAGRGMTLYNLLGLDKLDCQVALIKNAESAKMGKKDIIKIDKVIDINLMHWVMLIQMLLLILLKMVSLRKDKILIFLNELKMLSNVRILVVLQLLSRD